MNILHVSFKKILGASKRASENCHITMKFLPVKTILFPVRFNFVRFSTESSRNRFSAIIVPLRR